MTLAGDFLINLAASLAWDLLKAGAPWLRDLALGDEAERALRRCYEAGFHSMLEDIVQGLDPEHQALVEDVLRAFTADPQVAGTLLSVALAGADLPDLPALRAAFDALEFDRATLPVDFDRALSAFHRGLAAALVEEAGGRDSPLFERVSLGRVLAVQALLQEQRHTLDEIKARLARLEAVQGGAVYNIIIGQATGVAIGDRAQVVQAVPSDVWALLDEILNALRRLYPEPRLVWPVLPPPAQVPELRVDLLQPKYRLVPYTGQAFQETLQDLLTWARDLKGAHPPVGLRTYIGPGGAGKTRLLIEAGEALRGEGWRVGFLPAGRPTQDDAARLCAGARPTLLIVDYIADRAQEVRDLLRAAAGAAKQRATPLALVLVERAFPGWLKEDLQTYTDPAYVDWPAFLALPTVEQTPRPLPDLGAEEDRPALFEAARQRFAGLLPSADLGAAPRYAELPEAPLYVILLAWLAVSGVCVDHPTDPARVLDYAWGREREAWKRRLRTLFVNQPEERLRRALDLVEDLAVLATLGRTFPARAALVAFLEQNANQFRPIHGVAWDELAACLPDLFPRTGGSVVPPIAPDPVADFVLRRRLAARPELVTLALPTAEEAGAQPKEAVRAAEQTLKVLARLWEAAADGEAREQVEGWMGEAARRLAGWPAPAVNDLDDVLPVPDRTLALRPFLADFYRLRADLAQDGEERARALVMLGWAFSALGRREEALAATQEAVDAYRELAAAHPQAFLPDLAMSLTNLGAMLSDLGRREEALTATQEAVETYRALAAANPHAFRPDLASSLNNLGLRLSELGRREEALTATQEAVAIRRELAAADPPAFLPYLAISLNFLGDRLAETQHPQEALAAYEEAVRILAPFFLRLPAAFKDRMAYMVRDYLAACEAAGQEPDEALIRPIQEALRK